MLDVSPKTREITTTQFGRIVH